MGITNVGCYKCFSEGKSCDHTISQSHHLQPCHGCNNPLAYDDIGTIDGEFYCFDCMTDEQIRWSEQTIGLNKKVGGILLPTFLWKNQKGYNPISLSLSMKEDFKLSFFSTTGGPDFTKPRFQTTQYFGLQEETRRVRQNFLGRHKHRHERIHRHERTLRLDHRADV